MSIISKILKRFGIEKERDSYFDSSVDEINVNNSYIEITEVEFDFISDENLVQFTFDNISKLIGTYDKDEYKSVMKLNKPRQAIYMIVCLESEVNNGGFALFYSNSSRAFYKELPDALKLIGAIEYAKLMHRANTIYSQSELDSESSSISNTKNKFEELDEKFFNLYRTEDLYLKQVKFIRKNKSEFIG